MRFVVLLFAMLAFPVAAEAGYCDEQTATDVVVQTEAFAAGQLDKEPEPWGLCFDGAMTPALAKRFITACETIVTKTPDDEMCVRWSVELGAKKLGALDLFDPVATQFELRPFEDAGSLGIKLLVKLDDARGLPVVKAQWLAGDRDKRARSNRTEMVYRWSVWRHAAIKLFASRGTADDLAFLRDELTRTKDASVRRAIGKAIRTIETR